MGKWIGQHIFDLVAKFRSNVFLENIADGTVANDKFLGLDSNNKIVKEAIGTAAVATSATISAANSGGESSRAFLIALTMPYRGSFIASNICSLFIVNVSGIPSARFLPVIDISSLSDSGVAHPTVNLIFSAVDSPITHP